jgi:hypothetical protein
MAAVEVIKAWKDEEYREKLTAEQKATAGTPGWGHRVRATGIRG